MKRPSPKPSREQRRLKWKSVFLRKLADTGNVSEAIAAAGVARATVYTHRRTDWAFAAEWNASLDEAVANARAA